MHRLLGIITGAIATFITTYVHAKRRRVGEHRSPVRDGICDPQCRRENHADWRNLPHEDPRSVHFLSYLETVWLQSLAPREVIEATDANMERILFGHTEMLMDDLVERGAMSAQEAEHLSNYYEAMIFRTIVRY